MSACVCKTLKHTNACDQLEPMLNFKVDQCSRGELNYSQQCPFLCL